MPDFLACERKEPELKKIYLVPYPFFTLILVAVKNGKKGIANLIPKSLPFSLAAALLLNKDPIR